MNGLSTRLEKVILELEDRFSGRMIEATAATVGLDAALDHLDGQAVKTDRTTAHLGGDSGGIRKVSREARTGSSDLNQYTGRLNALLTTAATIGPVVIPTVAGLIPVVTGVAAGFGAAAGAVGVATLAFTGVGDAVKAVNAYAIEPTSQNLDTMREKLEAVGPAGRDLVAFVTELKPQLQELQNTARNGLFPGVEAGIQELMPLLPQVQQTIANIATEAGSLAEKAGQGLANDADFQRFFDYVEREASPTMDAFAKATGNVAAGIASLLVDAAPLTSKFSKGLVSSTRDFREWADGLNQTQGFRDFLSYVDQNGPKAVQLLESLAEALLGILHAAAPIGSAVLPVMTALAKVIAALANSPLGPIFYTAVAGMLVFNRTAALSSAAIEKLAAAWAFVTKAAGEAAVAQEAAAAAGETAGLAGAAGAAGAAGGAAKAAANAKITGPLSLLAASPYFTGGNIAAGAKFAGGASLTALIASLLANAGYNEVSKLVAPGQTDLGSKNNIMAITGSLQHGWQSKWRDPTAFIGFNPEGFGNKKPVQSADAGLASMVAGGQGKQAAAIFDDITASAQRQGMSVSDVRDRFKLYTAAVADADAAAKAAAKNVDVSTMSFRQLRQAVSDGTLTMRQQVAAEQALHQQSLSNFDAVTAFGKAVQNAAKQAASGAKGFNQYTAAGVANREAVSQMVAAWNQQPKSIRNNIGQYEAAKAKLVQFMTQMGATKAQITALTKAMNQPRKFVLGFQDEQALSAIARVKAQLASIPKSIRTDYYVNQINAANKPKVLPGVGRADGGEVPGRRHPYGDKVWIHAAPGEEVVSNRYGGADKNRAALRAASRGAKLAVVGYADGGTVRPRHVGPGGDEHDPKSKKKPLFTSEGPKYYKAALAHNRPFAKAPQDRDWPWQTGLTDTQERKFERWVDAKQVPFDVSARHVDYDMRGYWKKTKGKGWHQGSHFPDTWKTPYDTTFSHESRYATKDNPFYWHGDKLIDERNGQVIFAANGGFISGPGGPRDDRIPAWLSNGEFVVNAATTARLRPFLERENAKGYRDGGLIGDPFDYSINTHDTNPATAGAKATKAANDAATASTKKLTKTQQEHAAAVAKATGELRHLKLDLSGLRGSEFKDLRKDLRDLVGKDLRLTGDSLKDLNKASRLLNKSLTTTKSALDTAKSNRDSVVSSVTSGLSRDLWNVPDASTTTNVWTADSVGGPATWTPQYAISQLQGEKKDADEFNNLISVVQKKGITGPALGELLANGGIDALRVFAKEPSATDRAYEQAYGQATSAVALAEKNSGQAAYGPQIASLDKKVHDINVNLKAVKKAIKDKQIADHKSRQQAAVKAGQETAKAHDKSAKNAKTR